MYCPASTRRTSPVIARAASDSRNRTALLISCAARGGHRRSVDCSVETEPLRGAEAAAIEESEQLPIAPIQLGAHDLHTQRRKIDQELRQQRATDAIASIVRVHADRVQYRHRLQPAESSEINARHDKAYRHSVLLRNERNTHVR